MVGKLPEYSKVIFAGSADIDIANMEELLENNLPIRMPAPVVQQHIPASHKGLQKVLKWLEGQFEEKLTRPVSLTDYMQQEPDPEEEGKRYFVVLWGDGGKDTENLVDAAARSGWIVRDLTDGMDDLRLDDDSEPVQPEKTAVRRRHRQEAPAARGSRASREDDSSTDETDTPADLPELIAQAFEAAAETIRKHRPRRPLAAVVGLPAPEDTPEAAAPERRRSRPPKRAWLKNPELPDDDPDAYSLKGRGRPTKEKQAWPEITLTEAEEQELGLPGRDG